MLEQSVTQELISKAQDGNNEAKTELIEQNSPLIKSVIRRYRNKGVDYEDLYQLGCIGFLKAIRNFSDAFGVKFSTYAVPMIAGEVKRFLRDDGYIKVSRSVKSLASKINYYIEEYKNKNGDSPSIETIAEEFGIEAQEAVFVLDSAKFPVSLYDKTDDEHNRTLMDKLASKETVEDNLDRIVLKDAIQSLDEREKKIILLRYYRDKTQSEVARVLNVSQVQISRLENKILEKLKRGFS
ncbi:SigB/SigF/SigG family RNA polymerase sigma factor [Pumilibacter muris]|uniref:SigB/SigF/SigG family RNA polymerase sigma factor n=1 Tax=Pumilibacter muris TaxID=2941510 RepID=UPI00203AF41A|nr:SigB/SigF/SigG family RNA polymerase sigma factor [Pumilibacter muris]